MPDQRGVYADLRALWATRRSSGFPWPFAGVIGRGAPGGWRGRVHILVFGVWIYSPMPLSRKLAGIPLRPYRYARMVREIARARSRDFAPSLYDAES